MRRLVKAELKRACFSKGMLMALTIGIVISIMQMVNVQIPTYKMNIETDWSAYPTLFPNCLVETWLGGKQMPMESFAYFFIMPIMATLPFGVSYFSDEKSGFLKSVYTKTSRKDYLKAKYISTFVSAGIAVIVPLVINLLCCMMIIPNLLPQRTVAVNGMCALNLFVKLYYYHPLAYIFCFLIIDFMIAGIYGCIALVCSFITDYRIIVLIGPFFVQLGIHSVLSSLRLDEWSSVYFLQSGYGVKNPLILFVYIVFGISFTWIFFVKKSIKTDIF